MRRAALQWLARACAVAGWLGVVVTTPALAGAAFDYRSVGSEPAIFYDAPTQRGQKLFVAPRGMPVEVIVAQGEWLRVRDAAGDLAWVEKKALADRRTVVTTAVATVRTAASATAVVAFQVQKGVLLDLVEPASGGWVRVRHADGSGGWVSAAEVWGE